MNHGSNRKKIERASASLFLNLYNERFHKNIEIIELRDSPDIYCKDLKTYEEMYLEITLIEDLKGEIAYMLGRGQKPISPVTGSSVRSFFDDVVPILIDRIKDKTQSYYGKNTALVIRQTSPLWEPKEWKIVKDKIISTVGSISERNYGKGIWIICTNTETWPASDTIYQLWP